MIAYLLGKYKNWTQKHPTARLYVQHGKLEPSNEIPAQIHNIPFERVFMESNNEVIFSLYMFKNGAISASDDSNVQPTITELICIPIINQAKIELGNMICMRMPDGTIVGSSLPHEQFIPMLMTKVFRPINK